jgi:1,4-dihydroxy-2-naphthoate octaprenyltransferase
MRAGVNGGIVALLRLARPLFLVGGIVFNLLGAAAALAVGHAFDVRAFLLAQGAITATQLVTHFSNEYFDVVADGASIHATPWSGGSSVLPSGELRPIVALRSASACVLLACAFGVLLTLIPGTGSWTLPLLLAALALAWSYSGPPLRLHTRTLGEVMGGLLLAGLTPLFAYYVQAGWPSASSWSIAAPLLALQFAMLVTVSLPDVEGDAAAGKRTLAVALGRPRAARLAALATIGALLTPFVWWSVGVSLVVAASVFMWLPVGFWHAHRLWRLGAEPRWWSLGFWGIGLVMGPASALAAALLWIARGNGWIALPG